MTERIYRVVVTREDGAWLADVPDIPGTHTWARSLAALQRDVREVIAMQEDLPDGAETGLRIECEYVLGEPDLGPKAAELRALRERLERDEKVLAEGTAAAVTRLTRGGYSVRDVAELLSISPQRVSQIQPQPRRTPDRGHAVRSSVASANPRSKGGKGLADPKLSSGTLKDPGRGAGSNR